VNIECRSFTYGPYCSKTCNCSKDTSDGCEGRTGACRCKPGYHGDRCEIRKNLSISIKGKK